jgi:ATP-dependent DNA helicase 2 subunit 1
MALEEEVPVEPVDKTIPRYKQIDKRCAKYLEEFGVAFDKEFRALTQGKSKSLPTGRKRVKAAADDDDDDDEDDVKPKPARKKVKTEVKKETASQAPGMTDQEMANINDRGNISKQKVDALKAFLGDRGLDTKGKKLDLVDRVQGYLDKKGL